MTDKSSRIRIVLADDHPIVLDGLAQLFRLESDFEVVARCSDGEEAMRVLVAEEPDLIVLDVRMPRLDGLGVLERIRRLRLPTRVLLLTAAIESRQVVEALRLGARGLVLKEMAPEVVVQAARRVQAGGQWFDPTLVSRAVESWMQRQGTDERSSAKLTPREREIVSMVALGLRNRVIAERLGITEGTVKLHLHHVYEKLDLGGRVELLLFAQKHGY